MILYEAVIIDSDCRQLLAIQHRLAHLHERLDDFLPKSQFNVFLQPHDDKEHPQEIDISVAIGGELTAPQLTRLEQEVESTIGTKQTSPLMPSLRITEKVIQI